MYHGALFCGSEVHQDTRVNSLNAKIWGNKVLQNRTDSQQENLCDHYRLLFFLDLTLRRVCDFTELFQRILSIFAIAVN